MKSVLAFRSWLVGVALVMAAPCVTALEPLPPKPATPIPQGEVSPEQYQSLTALLQSLQASELPPGMLEQIRRMMTENPNANQRQMFDQLLRNQPELQDPVKRDELRRSMENWKKQMEQGRNLPKIDIEQPKFPPGQDLPGFDEKLPNREIPNFEPPNRFPPRNFDPEFPDPFRNPQDRDREARQKQMETAMRFWQQNIGPLDNNPAMKNLIADMFTGSSSLDPKTAEGLADIFKGIEADGANPEWLTKGAGKLFENWEPSMLGFKFSDLKRMDLPDVGGVGGGWSAPSTGGMSVPSAGGWSGGGMPSGEGSWLSVVLFVLVLVGALLLWRFWPLLMGDDVRRARPIPLPGLGAWPVDPRQIADRESLVRAFEYLSVLVCGNGAKVWNHVTIATALQRVSVDAADAAEPLARLYALARYTPAGEPLPPAALAEARRHLCRLAGVSAS